MKHDVFISYSSHDKQIADAICSLLENNKIRCWIAPRDILGGMEYGEVIIDAIVNCSIVVLVFSANSNNSIFVRKEIERAISKEKIIIPFRIENILPTKAMEFALGNTHWLDALTPPLESHITTLAITIHRLLNTEESFLPPPKPDKETIPKENKGMTWLMKTTNGPGQRSCFGMSYDDKKEGIILHGGFGSANENDRPEGFRMYHSPNLSDTWFWNGSSWQLVHNNPLILQNHALAHDKLTQQNIIHGGWSGSRRMGETYIMTENDWIKTEPDNNNPGVRENHSMIYDEKRKSIILFGGSNMKLEFGQFTKAIQIAFDDTWEFIDNGWTKLHVNGPDPRWGHSMVYDQLNGLIVLFGGSNDSKHFDDTWIWDGNTASWNKINAQNVPSARCNHAMTYDCVSKKVLLFGGKTESDIAMNDLWEWDGNDWKLLMKHTPLKPRYNHGFVYDVKRSKSILFGGFDGKDYFQDTWEFTY